MTARLRQTLSMTPFISNHGRSARRICSENEMPSRSLQGEPRIASSRSPSSLSAVSCFGVSSPQLTRYTTPQAVAGGRRSTTARSRGADTPVRKSCRAVTGKRWTVAPVARPQADLTERRPHGAVHQDVAFQVSAFPIHQ